MGISQAQLVQSLTNAMNDCATSWIVYGIYEPTFIASRLVTEVPQLSGSRAMDDGWALSATGDYEWIFVDADRGSAAFIIPRDDAGSALRAPLQALEPSLSVTPCIYGNVNDRVWLTLGGGTRMVMPAQDFLPR